VNHFFWALGHGAGTSHVAPGRRPGGPERPVVTEPELALARGRAVRGQIIQDPRDMTSASSHEHSMVSTRPPKKPSQVFLGDSLISGVRPKKKPAAPHAGSARVVPLPRRAARQGCSQADALRNALCSLPGQALPHAVQRPTRPPSRPQQHGMHERGRLVDMQTGGAGRAVWRCPEHRLGLEQGFMHPPGRRRCR